MPKLSDSVLEKKRTHIEAAAKDLFIMQGFHATPMREIASRAEVSLGNLYNYYRTKEDLLESIIKRHQSIINAGLGEMLDELDEPFMPESMRRFGQRVRTLVNEHSDYWLLMYIDVLEFENRHFRKMFEGLAKSMRKRFGSQFTQLEAGGRLIDGVDPAVGFTAAYMQFFNYFLVEKLFGGSRHFGLSDDDVIRELTEIFCRGVLNPETVETLNEKKRRLNGRGASAQRTKTARQRKPQKK